MGSNVTMENSVITYEQLNDLTAEFDNAELETTRQDIMVKIPLYHKRQEMVAQIPNFWPLVFEQAPPEIDEFIQPSDSALLLNSLKSFSVSHFEFESDKRKDPRSLLFRFEFSENDYIEDRVIEKKFWQRRSASGWSGLVSEPVMIHWKPAKDLTGGLLGMVKKVWDARQSKPETARSKAEALTADERALKRKIKDTSLGSMSFFAWFGYIGRIISVKESDDATTKWRQERLARQAGGGSAAKDDNAVEAEDQDGDDDLEIFEGGENLAIALAEDLWTNAIKHFTTAQEQDEVSDDDFESDVDTKGENDADAEPKDGKDPDCYKSDDDSEKELPPAKRHKKD